MQSIEHLPATASAKIELVGPASSPPGGRCERASRVFATVGLQLERVRAAQARGTRVRPKENTAIEFSTFPHAKCTLTASDPNTASVAHRIEGLDLYADAEGNLRFFASNLAESGASRFYLACTGPQPGRTVYTLQLRAAREATPEMPFAPRPQERKSTMKKGPLPLSSTDADKLSAAELQRIGIPPRPDRIKDPQAYEHWKKIVTTGGTSIVPDLVTVPEHHQSHAESLSTWSGWAYVDVNRPNPFREVYGEWVVPTTYPPGSGCPPVTDSAFWVGLDGYVPNIGELVQAGTVQNRIDFGGTFGIGGFSFTDYHAWVQWFPEPAKRIVNIPVSPGDTMDVDIWVDTATTPQSAYAFVYDNGLGGVVQFSQGSIPYVGNSAEAIMERPSNAGPDALARFGIATMKFAKVLTDGEYRSIADLTDDKSIDIDMVDGSSALSYSSLPFNNGQFLLIFLGCV